MARRNMHSPGRVSIPFQSKGERSRPDPGLITPEARAALAHLLDTNPHRFVAACVAAQVTSLRQIPAFCELLVTDPWRAREIALLAEDAGILHLR